MTTFPNPADSFLGRIIDMERRVGAIELALYDSGIDGSYVNMVDNGAMNVAQRGAQVAGATTSKYLLDRWQLLLSALGTWTYSQDTDVPLGEEFTHSAKLLVTTADPTPAATDFAIFSQMLEGQDVQHLLYGSVVAEACSLSFWVKANVIGTYIAELRNAAATTKYVGEAYEIAQVGVWERKTLTIPGDVATAITNDNAGRLRLDFFLDCGSDLRSATLLQTTWGTSTTGRAVGQANLAASVNNYIKFTGVQLEIGSPSPFETRRYSDELSRCQRYALYPSLTNDYPRHRCSYRFANGAEFFIPTPTPMRANPTHIGTINTDFRVFEALTGAGLTISSMGTATVHRNGVMITANLTTAPVDPSFAWATAFGGLSADI